ncbi:MAG: hypothetical protein J5685_02240 [Clostridiales bacterium]|nr:hypothetical protein [Clostridiales bacterium]
MKKFVCGILCVSVLFSLCGCGRKKVIKIDDDDLTDAFEEFFDWEEDDDYRVSKNREVRGINYEDLEDPYFYDANLYIQGAEFTEDTTYAYILYIEFEDEDDASEYFSHYYDEYTWVDDDDRYYRDGQYGYIFDNDEKEKFSGYLYAEDMVIEFSSYDADGVKILRDMFRSLKLPA